MAKPPTSEPRALSAALAAPPFHTRGGGAALHAANRHVERWAPETGASRVRSLRSLGFVDRLVAPWIETAQRSASIRLFAQYAQSGPAEREGGAVSWVFPRPWYQDELDWMAAARHQAEARDASEPTPTMLTTRGTYVAPSPSSPSARAAARPAARPSSVAVPSALYEYVAPSLSIAPPQTQAAGIGYGGSADAYSPLVPLAAVQAAALMSRAVAPLLPPTAGTGAEASSMGRLSPALRGMLTTMLARAAAPTVATAPSTRLADAAPTLVTPPSPRPEPEGTEGRGIATTEGTGETAGLSSSQLADHYAGQRAHLVEVQRVATQAAQRQLAASAPSAPPPELAAAPRERAALDDKIAQRIAERTAERAAQQRLHEQSRTEAAQHARGVALPAPQELPRAEAPAPRAPAEVLAAISALPPELAALLSDPGRAGRSITDVTEALRTVELMARSTASSAPFVATRGPRLMMPAGIGGLVAAVDRAPLMRPVAPIGVAPSLARPPAPRRAPALPFLAAPHERAVAGSSALTRPTSAFGATTSTTPSAITHVGWADRWLARFAGATPRTLDLLAATTAASPQARLQALADAAPGTVFVAPQFDASGSRPSIAAEAPGTSPVSSAGPAGTERYADDAETPDDVFAQIAAAAMTKRAAAPVATAMSTPRPVALPIGDHQGVADLVAQDVPAAPGAGLSSQLASSPFAPALRHVLALPVAPSFDVRALFGADLSATYLAGLLAPSTHEVTTGSGWAPAAWSASTPGADDAEGVAGADRRPAWDPTYVAPELPALGALGAVDADGEPAVGAASDEAAALALPETTTLRTALLSWTADVAVPGTSGTDAVTGGPTVTAAHTTPLVARRGLIDPMTMPLLGEPSVTDEHRAAGWTSPGMLAERAHGWSVEQERSASDLSLDFVSPELLLAAQVYGLGPAEAAQAVRLAIAGPGQLTAMAGAVDRTFVQAMAIDADRRAGRSARGPGSASAAPTFATPGFAAPDMELPIATAYPMSDPPAPGSAAPGSAFGIGRRAPRGAFLWPSATVAALGLQAAAPDGDHGASVAALELLAAQAVAELGTYAALSEAPTTLDASSDAADRAGAMPVGVAPDRASADGAYDTAAERRRVSVPDAEPGEADVLGAAAALVPASRRSRFDALYVALSRSSTGRAWSPAARAARALALAGRSEDGPVSAYERAATAWDVLPVVYGVEAASDAAAAGAMPAFGAPGTSARGAGGARGARAGRDPDAMVTVDGRPGLGALSSRAGEALGSYVAPAAAEAAPASVREAPMSPAMRAPTAAPELVQTGRPASGRHGGGEVEIPSWFEAAARKMLEDRSGNADGISLAELTLVTAAPSSHVAASARGAGSASLAPSAPPAGGSDKAAKEQLDIEKVADDIYRKILVMMDAARARNGEPYL